MFAAEPGVVVVNILDPCILADILVQEGVLEL